MQKKQSSESEALADILESIRTRLQEHLSKRLAKRHEAPDGYPFNADTTVYFLADDVGEEIATRYFSIHRSEDGIECYVHNEQHQVFVARALDALSRRWSCEIYLSVDDRQKDGKRIRHSVRLHTRHFAPSNLS